MLPQPLPRRNPVPREQRRASLDRASSEEWAHHEHSKSERSFLSCWFCWHDAVEHLDHDWLLEICPDCRIDGSSVAG